MKIGINTYFNEWVVGSNVAEFHEEEIIKIFGDSLSYSQIAKILESKPDNEEILFRKSYGSGEMAIEVYHIDETLPTNIKVNRD